MFNLPKKLIEHLESVQQEDSVVNASADKMKDLFMILTGLDRSLIDVRSVQGVRTVQCVQTEFIISLVANKLDSLRDDITTMEALIRTHLVTEYDLQVLCLLITPTLIQTAFLLTAMQRSVRAGDNLSSELHEAMKLYMTAFRRTHETLDPYMAPYRSQIASTPGEVQ